MQPKMRPSRGKLNVDLSKSLKDRVKVDNFHLNIKLFVILLVE